MKKNQFEQLYEEHAQGLLAFLVYRTGDRAEAEEVLADTFERVLRTRTRFDPRRGSAKSWLYSIALNRLRDGARRQDSERRALERNFAGATAATSEMDRIDDRSALAQALGNLREEEREALALRFGADLSVPEVAKLLGIKLATAEGRVYRGLGRLRELLEGHEFGR